jgi:predicted transcriptional regulator
MQKTLSDTSLSAYHQLESSDMQSAHYHKIINALNKIGKGICEEIADVCDLHKSQVHRRVSEMEKLEPPLIYKTEEKRKTSSGRSAYVYQLRPTTKHIQLESTTLIQAKLFV